MWRKKTTPDCAVQLKLVVAMTHAPPHYSNSIASSITANRRSSEATGSWDAPIRLQGHLIGCCSVVTWQCEHVIGWSVVHGTVVTVFLSEEATGRDSSVPRPCYNSLFHKQPNAQGGDTICTNLRVSNFSKTQIQDKIERHTCEMCLVKLRIGLENRAITIIDLLE